MEEGDSVEQSDNEKVGKRQAWQPATPPGPRSGRLWGRRRGPGSQVPGESALRGSVHETPLTVAGLPLFYLYLKKKISHGHILCLVEFGELKHGAPVKS